MAVANFQYITRMSSGFKVYILEGQPGADRYRHMTNDRSGTPAAFPMKRKCSHDKGLTLEERRERAINKTLGKMLPKAAPGHSMMSSQQTPLSPKSPLSSSTSPVPTHVYYAPVMDEPLALIKKPRKDTGSTEDKTKNSTQSQFQMRPSVITCASALRKPSCTSAVDGSHSPVSSKHKYDHVLEEHFQRSLGKNYQQASSPELSISVSVDDHFAKALGDKWLQIKSKSSSCSSTPPSSPSVTHSPNSNHSPNVCHK